MIYEVIVVGGGPSGMMAAITAARQGKKVLLLEKNKRVGKKLLVTGNGRCNLTNKQVNESHYHTTKDMNGFFADVMDQYGLEDTIGFFESLGIPLVEGPRGKLYPRSLQASSVVEALLIELERVKVKVETQQAVEKITKAEAVFKVFTSEMCYKGKSLVFAVGGKASPDLGSDGRSYSLIEHFGHRLTTILPGIIQLKTQSSYLKSLKGTRLDAKVSLVHENKTLVCESYGEILFTDYGVSGPAILDISSYAARMLNHGVSPMIHINLVPDLEQVHGVLTRRLDYAYKKTVQDFLIGFLNKRLIIPVLKTAGIDIHKKACELSKEERKKLARTLEDFSMPVIGTNQWNQAQVTIGGVPLGDIHSHTLESKYCKGLYLTGEVMDIDGDCGGYNLQWAWSTGYVAGINCGGRDDV